MCSQVFCGVKCEAHGVMEVGKCVSILQPLFSYCGRYRLRMIDHIDSVEEISIHCGLFLVASLFVARRANVFCFAHA